MKNIKRDSNFELLRIVSMLFIILWHIIYHGHMINNCQNANIRYILQILQFIMIVHVNSFVLLSGYFQSKSKFRLSRLLEIVFQVIFYSIIIYVVAIKLGFVSDYNYMTIFDKFNWNAIGDYWFISSYLIMYIFSDYINKFINSLNQSEFKKFLFIGFLVFSIIPVISKGKILNNTGYNFYHFIYMYILGAYLRLYPLRDNYYFSKLSDKKYRILLIGIFFLCVCINCSLIVVVKKINGLNYFWDWVSGILSYNKFAYSFPLIIVQSVCFFELFKSIKFKNKYINYFAGYVFGVYLIHDNALVRGNLYKIMQIDRCFSSYKMLLYIFAVAILILVVCLFIDILRAKLFEIIKKLRVKRSSN
jgi:surface polysaccharide O-acyltransferase-like enzyme